MGKRRYIVRIICLPDRVRAKTVAEARAKARYILEMAVSATSEDRAIEFAFENLPDFDKIVSRTVPIVEVFHRRKTRS